MMVAAERVAALRDIEIFERLSRLPALGAQMADKELEFSLGGLARLRQRVVRIGQRNDEVGKIKVCGMSILSFSQLCRRLIASRAQELTSSFGARLLRDS